MRKRTIAIAGAGVTTAALLGAGGVAWAMAGGDEAPLTGDARAKAVEAARAHLGGGTVVETEAEDDGAAYGVELRLPGGPTIEVSLDRDFAVIGQEADDDGAREEPGAGDD